MFRRMLVALIPLVSAVALIAVAPVPAQARNFCGTTDYCETDYYNDAAHDVYVGEFYIACNGVSYQSGSVTPYYTMSQTPCN